MNSRFSIVTNTLLISLTLLLLGVSASETATSTKKNRTRNEIKSKVEAKSDLKSNDDENFFSNPNGSPTRLPHYRTDAKPAE
jgi:hypothetical protein